MLHGGLSTNTSENCRDVWYCADLGFLVAVFAWNYRLFIREFLREDHLEAFLDAHVAESLADDICQRAVEGLRDVGDADLCRIIFRSSTHWWYKRNTVVHTVFDKMQLRGKSIDRIYKEINLKSIIIRDDNSVTNGLYRCCSSKSCCFISCWDGYLCIGTGTIYYVFTFGSVLNANRIS